MAATILVGTVSNACVDGGDAPEMEARVNAVLQSGGRTDFLADAQITGVGVGPRWLTQLSIVSDPNAGTLAPLADVRAFVRRAGNPAALDLFIEQVLAANPTMQYLAIRVDGGGAGRDYMALILLYAAPIE